MRLEILLTAAFFFVGTCLSGYGMRRLLKLKNEGILFSVMAGIMFWWALMELVLVPMTMRLAGFRAFVNLYSALIAVSCAAGLFCWKDILADIRSLIGNGRQYLTLGHAVALILICYQLYFIHHHMYLEWDDTYYVNLANTAVYTDKIYWVYPETGAFADFDKRYVLSLWPIFYAWLSSIFHVLPTIMAHTILPWLMIPAAYTVYGLIAKQMFAENTQLQGMFLSFAVLMHLYMSGEHTAGLTFLSITPWVGKGVLAAVLLPMLFYCTVRTSREGKAANWIFLGLTCLAGCLLSSMGILLSPVFTGTVVCLQALQKKSMQYLLCGAAACLPCIILGIYYIYLTH
ncbi:MAG TPA: hypothetical protein DD414_01340 [Lachnospiraceae bacterium]|nr:hypothetical protein [Lachnospiraceae bacterium]